MQTMYGTSLPRLQANEAPPERAQCCGWPGLGLWVLSTSARIYAKLWTYSKKTDRKKLAMR
jgi:hypothetical protein